MHNQSSCSQRQENRFCAVGAQFKASATIIEINLWLCDLCLPPVLPAICRWWKRVWTARNREVSREGNLRQAEISLLAMCGLCSSSDILQVTEIREEKGAAVIVKIFLKAQDSFYSIFCIIWFLFKGLKEWDFYHFPWGCLFCSIIVIFSLRNIFPDIQTKNIVCSICSHHSLCTTQVCTFPIFLIGIYPTQCNSGACFSWMWLFCKPV